MRTRLWLVLLLLPLAALPARAQETRGNISGTVARWIRSCSQRDSDPDLTHAL